MNTDELNHAARQIMPAAPAGFSPATEWQHAKQLLIHTSCVTPRLFNHCNIRQTGNNSWFAIIDGCCHYNTPSTLTLAIVDRWAYSQSIQHGRPGQRQHTVTAEGIIRQA